MPEELIKGNKDDCNSYRATFLLIVPGKVDGGVLNERMKLTDTNILGNEKGGFRRGRGCVDQVFALKIIAEKYLGKVVLTIYGLCGQWLEGTGSFYEDTSASVHVNGELSGSSGARVGVRKGCVMSPGQFIIHMGGCMREVKARVRNLGVRLEMKGREQSVVAGLFVDDTVLLAESECSRELWMNLTGNIEEESCK